MIKGHKGPTSSILFEEFKRDPNLVASYLKGRNIDDDEEINSLMASIGIKTGGLKLALPKELEAVAEDPEELK